MSNNSMLLLGFGKDFVSKAGVGADIDTTPKKQYYDFIAVSERGVTPKQQVKGNVLFCPSGGGIPNVSCNTSVTCGMSRKSALSFSSVRFDEAMLSVAKRIDGKGWSLYQGDCRTSYDSDLTLYENLVLEGMRAVRENLGK